MGVQVLSMSCDSVFVHKMWVEHELSKMITAKTVPFPMLSDGGGKVGFLHGVHAPEAGVNVRGRFLIDPDGVIHAYEVLSPPVGRNVNETIRQIQALQLVRESKGSKATPSGCRPGKEPLSPVPNRVGKVCVVWNVRKAFESSTPGKAGGAPIGIQQQ